MKAIVQTRYGSAERLELREIDRPAYGENEVLLRVRAAGVDPGVWHLMTGRPYLVRMMGFGLRAPKIPVRGRDVAGLVEAVGPGVAGFAPGDEVYGTCETGSFAEYATARQDRLAPKPPSLSFEQAAAVPISGVTALQAVTAAGVREGQRVLVIGAAGGVGTFAVQLARAKGATVTGVCGKGKANLVLALGADSVIDYTREEVDHDGPRYDVVIDTAGNRRLSLLRRAMTPHGVLIIVGGEHGRGRLLGGFGRQIVRAPLISLVGGQRLRGLAGRENAADLNALTTLIDEHTVTPVIDRTYPLDEAPEAIRYLAAGHAAGKTVITL